MALQGWQRAYETGVDAMDQQHRQLFVLLERLHGTFQGAGEGAEEVEEVLAALLDYAKVHFRDEEDLMRRHFFPGLAEHIAQHGELVEQLVLKVGRFREGQLTPMQLAIFLRDWIVHHMIEEDHKYGDFIRARRGKGLAAPARPAKRSG